MTLEFEADGAQVAKPLDVVIYSHVLTNTGNYTDTFDLEYWSNLTGWIIGQEPDERGGGAVDDGDGGGHPGGAAPIRSAGR